MLQPPDISSAERYWTDKLVDLLRGKLLEAYPPGKTLRDTHVKPHGCVQAEFIVEPGLPQDLQVGLFGKPQTCQAWIRFSSSDGSVRNDKKRDVMGMSIKLIDPGPVGGTVPPAHGQDFLLGSAKVFPSRSVEQFCRFMEAYDGGWTRLVLFILNPSHGRVLWLMARMAKQYGSPLTSQYWSMTPYKWGTGAVKYSARPLQSEPAKPPRGADPDYLRDAMKAHLAAREARFDFMVQRRTHPDRMPIDDPSVEWPEDLSPFLKVATIRIPPAEFDTPERWAFCENLSFAPWHCLPEHEPLGSMNVARGHMYRVLSEFRHQRNNIVPRPPYW